MISALLLPTILLAAVLLAGAALLLVLRAAFDKAMARGMGHRPMFSLSRATYPMARSAGAPARPPSASPRTLHGQGAARRVVKQGEEPRGAAPAHAWPFSSLINTPAAGAPRFPLP